MKMLSILFAVSAAACSSTSSAKPLAAPPPPVAVAPTPSTDTLIQLAAKRAQLIGWLHDYREAGVFPADAAGKPLSAFVDAQGIRCPMAEMLHKAGRDDLVAAVQKEANTVRLADVHAGPLHAWMLSSGLTQEEISLVQGAMNISFDWIEEDVPQEHEHILAGKAAVRAKLEVAEMALRDNTATSLLTAANRLGKASVGTLAAMPIQGAVVPATAVPRAVAATPPVRRQLRAVRRYGGFDPSSMVIRN